MTTELCAYCGTHVRHRLKACHVCALFANAHHRIEGKS